MDIKKAGIIIKKDSPKPKKIGEELAEWFSVYHESIEPKDRPK